ncbi:hypothetical protein [Streptomyces sp. NPDC002644]
MSVPAARAAKRVPVAVAAVAVAALLTTGCDAVSTALDCARTATAIADSVAELQQAVDAAANDPTQLEESLASIDRNLDELGDSTGDADVGKAVDDLRAGVDQVQKSVEAGDATPDVSPITDASAELTKVCTP